MRILLTRLSLLLQSFDLQRVLEGEKALRSEATRQLKEVEKKLVSLRSPAVALSSPMPAPPGSERTLEADKAMLQDQIKSHSAQVCHDTYCGNVLTTQNMHFISGHDAQNKLVHVKGILGMSSACHLQVGRTNHLAMPRPCVPASCCSSHVT